MKNYLETMREQIGQKLVCTPSEVSFKYVVLTIPNYGLFQNSVNCASGHYHWAVKEQATHLGIWVLNLNKHFVEYQF